MKEKLLFGLALLVGCNGKTQVGGACKVTSECVAGTFCNNSKCSTLQCTQNSDCGSQQICTADSQCTSGRPTLAITAIHGDTVSAGAPQGFATVKGFVVTGAGFDKTVTAQLIDASKKVYDLVVSSASASAFSAALPVTIVPGTYSLRVATATGGSVARDTSILQGPAGADGPAGPPATPNTAGTNVAIAGDVISLAPTIVLSNSSASTSTLSIANATGTALEVTSGVVDFSKASQVKLPAGTGTIQTVFAGDNDAGHTTLTALCPINTVVVGGKCDCADDNDGNDVPTKWNTTCSAYEVGSTWACQTSGLTLAASGPDGRGSTATNQDGAGNPLVAVGWLCKANASAGYCWNAGDPGFTSIEATVYCL